MTGPAAWHARVDLAGSALGSGFLVSERHVLTCAHVVQQMRETDVVFPGAPALGPVPATVAVRGPWAGRAQDPGDVAVLELSRPVGLTPAAFAGLEDAYGSPSPRLVAHGFPDGYGEEGVQSELRATSRRLIGDEWSQLELWTGYGQQPTHGFSGAAAVLEEGGTVVGMVSAHDETARNGRMIPTRILARHWSPLAELIPTPGYGPEEKRSLRELVARLPEPGAPAVGELVRSSAGPLGVQLLPPIDSLWAAAWLLLSETRPSPGNLPLADFAVRLADASGPAPAALGLRDWARAHRAAHAAPMTAGRADHGRRAHGVEDALGPHGAAARARGPHATEGAHPSHETAHPDAGAHDPGLRAMGNAQEPTAAPSVPSGAIGPPPFPPSPADWSRSLGQVVAAPGPAAEPRPRSPILVTVRHSGADRNALLVEVAAYRDGRPQLIGEQRLARNRVRDWVLARIDEAFGAIDAAGRELIAFSLPRDWINQPVDEWRRRQGMRTPLGCHAPVVVLDHERRASELLQFKLRKMWAVLDGRPGSDVHPLPCDVPQRPEQLSVRLQDVYGPVGLPRPPRSARDRLHRAVLDAPAPIVLWPRTGCPGPGGGRGPCGDDCRGGDFLRRLGERLAALPPDELPEQIMELRKNAFTHEGPEPHWAKGVSLVWEDPRWFPEAGWLRHSPVG
ncbi:VMAP-C domain-containing protein [Streptomyces sp. MUM 178J]|uniref:VMAP-C domain-containing protein n=1 Tax=Streptomyces sp. MUM 178J TaxID=2791991 RepID=UPI001F03CB48|nr:trypsin-like peptidase domain-containing protein [Streptomyces sp. MUM 178J]WRQ79225.1 trypsin-like peptidase domain-containing protein [Streptomyces sp. MUM 178J]